MSKWYKEDLKGDGIAVSTRVRLARNVRKVPFPKKMNDTQRREMLQTVRELCDGKELAGIGALKYIDMQAVPADEVAAMVERHIISPDFAKSGLLRGLVLSPDESVSVMLLEEDHIRIQVILPGLQTEKAYELAEQVENLFAGGLTLAFDPKLGYLTECPTNLGTGLRASVIRERRRAGFYCRFGSKNWPYGARHLRRGQYIARGAVPAFKPGNAGDFRKSGYRKFSRHYHPDY